MTRWNDSETNPLHSWASDVITGRKVEAATCKNMRLILPSETGNVAYDMFHMGHSHSRRTAQRSLHLIDHCIDCSVLPHPPFKSGYECHRQRFLLHPLCLVLDPCQCQIRGQVPHGPHYWNSKCQRVQVIKWISSLPKETNHLVWITSFTIGVSTEYTHTYCFLYHICLNCVSISSLACITQRDSSSLWFWYNTDITGTNTLYPNSLIINKCASDRLHYGVQLEIDWHWMSISQWSRYISEKR